VYDAFVSRKNVKGLPKATSSARRYARLERHSCIWKEYQLHRKILENKIEIIEYVFGKYEMSGIFPEIRGLKTRSYFKRDFVFRKTDTYRINVASTKQPQIDRISPEERMMKCE